MWCRPHVCSCQGFLTPLLARRNLLDRFTASMHLKSLGPRTEEYLGRRGVSTLDEHHKSKRGGKLNSLVGDCFMSFFFSPPT